MTTRLLTCLALSVAMLGAIGCGNRISKVSGVMMLEGKPLEGVDVLFTPVGKGRPATGTTDEKGHFNLTTNQPNDGAYRGDYKITITKASSKPSAMPGMSLEQVMADSLQREQERNVGKSMFPSVYSDIEQTPLRRKVPPRHVVLKLNQEGT